MKRILVVATWATLTTTAWGQGSLNTSSAAQSGAMANGGNSNVVVNLGSGDPPAQTVAPTPAATDPTTHIKEDLRTTGNPGAMSFGVSFSQYNCANTAGAGVGFLGGVVQLGGGLESTPCNDRANASAFFQIAQTLATSNPQLSAQLFHAAILLIGNSTKDTKAALAAAGVSDWVETPAGAPPMQITPPAPMPAPPPEGQTTPVPTPEVTVTLPTPEIATPEDVELIKTKMFAAKQ